MLRIRSDQMAIFQELAENRFEEDIVSSLIPARAGDESLRPFARAAIEKAKRYGIADLRDVARLVVLMLNLGIDFEEQPEHGELKRVLGDASLDSDSRLDLILDLLGELDAPEEG